MKKLRELAEKIDFNEGSSESVQDAFLRHLLKTHHSHGPQNEQPVLAPRKVRSRRRKPPLTELDSPEQLSFDFGDHSNKKS